MDSLSNMHENSQQQHARSVPVFVCASAYLLPPNGGSDADIIVAVERGGPYVDASKGNLLPEPGFSRRRRRPQILIIMQNRNFMNHTYACIRQVLCRVPMSGTCVKSPRFPTPDLLDHETRLWEKQCGNEVCLDLLCRWMGGF